MLPSVRLLTRSWASIALLQNLPGQRLVDRDDGRLAGAFVIGRRERDRKQHPSVVVLQRLERLDEAGTRRLAVDAAQRLGEHLEGAVAGEIVERRPRGRQAVRVMLVEECA